MIKQVVSVTVGYNYIKKVERLDQNTGNNTPKVVDILVYYNLSGTIKAVYQDFKAVAG